MHKEPKTVSKKQAFFFLFFSTLIISGIPTLCYQSITHFLKERKKSPKYFIEKIVQTGPTKKALPTKYLAEWLDLSIDDPVNLYAVSVEEKQKALEKSPLIEKASLKKFPPNTLYVDYTVRKPIAKVADFENMAMDKKGYLFPFYPYFPAKNLPEIYFGIESFSQSPSKKKRVFWNEAMSFPEAKMAQKILTLIEEQPLPFSIKKIDLSRAFLERLGKREVIFQIEERVPIQKGNKGYKWGIFPKILRLSPKNIHKQLGNFLVLREKMLIDYQEQLKNLSLPNKEQVFSQQIIDFRIDELAFIQENIEEDL